MTADELANRFDIPGVLRFEPAAGGLTRAVIATSSAEADLYLQGAHLTHWTPRGQRPVLFVSPTSLFAAGKAIRGGVPIIFPWFGPRSDGKPGPAHGFARTSVWTVEGVRLREGDRVEITLSISPSNATRQFCDSDFRMRFRVTVGSELEMELETSNEGKIPFTFEEALHTYLAVSDVERVSLFGLDNTVYIDKTDGFKRKKQESEVVRIAKETDQVHLGTLATCTVWDPVWHRRVIVEKNGSASTVIWNPWSEKSKGMSDMEPDGWKQMVCVETANVATDAVALAPGASHRLTVKIRVEQD